jgi:type IV pilus assembly protein PilA
MSETQQKKTLGIAIASLILGCLFLIPLLGLLFSLAALILGIVAVVKISNNKETLKGKGLAITGIVLGSIGIVMIPIIAMLAAIAIPNFLRARNEAQESAAAMSMHTIVAAEVAYKAENESFTSLARLSQANPPYIDSILASGTKQGYKFTLDTFNPEYFYATAAPLDAYGGRALYIDEDAILCISDEMGVDEIRRHIDSQGCPTGYLRH